MHGNTKLKFSRTVVRIYRLSDVYTSNESGLCSVGAGSVKGENMAVRQLETVCL